MARKKLAPARIHVQRLKSPPLGHFRYAQPGDGQLELADVELIGTQIPQQGGPQRPRGVAAAFHRVVTVVGLDTTTRPDERSHIMLVLQNPSSCSISGNTVVL